MTDRSPSSTDLEALLGDLTLTQRDKHPSAVVDLQARINTLKDSEELAHLINASEQLDRQVFRRVAETMKNWPEQPSQPWCEFFATLLSSSHYRRQGQSNLKGCPLDVETRRHSLAVEHALNWTEACEDLLLATVEDHVQQVQGGSVAARRACSHEAWMQSRLNMDRFSQDLAHTPNFEHFREAGLLRAREHADLGLALLQEQPGSKRLHDAFANADRHNYRLHMCETMNAMSKGNQVDDEDFASLVEKVRAADDERLSSPRLRPR